MTTPTEMALSDRLENDIRELRGAGPYEMARRLIERGWSQPATEGLDAVIRRVEQHVDFECGAARRYAFMEEVRLAATEYRTEMALSAISDFVQMYNGPMSDEQLHNFVRSRFDPLLVAARATEPAGDERT